ncbi:MAG TPA: hypothetical protein VHE30_27525 [Polyangiaceae bacterium]|nr:hypothetical protein [Polyangiaceae bacterium]
MADESPTEEKKEAAPAAAKAPRAEAARPPTEEEIDSPDQKTLTLLFVLFAVTVGSWGAARFACNMHPPESRSAPKVPTERLLTTAKDGAIEFIQRYRSSDFDGALQCATGDLVAQVTQKKEDCDKRANECAREREAQAGRLTTAVVDKEDGFVGDAHVTTALKGETEKWHVIMKRDGVGMYWKAASATRE